VRLRRGVIQFGLAAMLLSLTFPVEAQQPKKIPRIDYLDNTAAASATYTKAFRERLRELGYLEGQNITIEPKYWEGKVEALAKLAEDLVRLNCDVIVTAGTEAGNAARKATQKIPIVLAFGVDVLRLGFVADIAHPGENITGLTSIGVDINRKRLELLKEVVPKLSLVAFLWTSTSPSADDNLQATESLAPSLGLGFSL
jgi:putative tryptophan/tyrosine transport system substrate-binding protein